MLVVESKISNSTTDKVKAETKDRFFVATMRLAADRTLFMEPVTDLERPEESQTHGSNESSDTVDVFKVRVFKPKAAGLQSFEQRLYLSTRCIGSQSPSGLTVAHDDDKPTVCTSSSRHAEG